MSYEEILLKVRESKKSLSRKRKLYSQYNELINYLESLQTSFKAKGIAYEPVNISDYRLAFSKGDYESALDLAESAKQQSENDYNAVDKISESIDNLSQNIADLPSEISETYSESIAGISKQLKEGSIGVAKHKIVELKASFEKDQEFFAGSDSIVAVLQQRIETSREYILVDEFEKDLSDCESLRDSNDLVACRKKVEEVLELIDEALVSWEPDIDLQLPSEIIASQWNKSVIRITNSGKVSVNSVSLSLEGVKSQDEMETGYIAPNGYSDTENAIFTESLGSIKVKIQLSFARAYDDSVFSKTVEKWIESKRSSAPVAATSEPEVIGAKVIESPALAKHRELVTGWQLPESSNPETQTVLELFTKRWESYSLWPDNKAVLDYLHNNHERLAVSSYFEIPTDPSVMINEWALPEGIRGNVYLDSDRSEHITRVVTSDTSENFVIIGEPGVGKTTLLFEVFDSFMDKRPAAIITTSEMGSGSVNLDYDLRLFYDDIPENEDLVSSILENDSKGLIVTAREADWSKLSEDFQHKFTRLTVPLFSADHMDNLCRRMLDFSNIRYDEPAIEKLKAYSQGSPIFVWLLIREMRFNGIYFLTKSYVSDNSRKGMENYVSLILQKLLKEGSNYKKGGFHSLACMIFLSDYMKDRKCHELLYRAFADVIEDDFAEMFDDDQSTITFNQTIVYLSGEGSLIRFPHDTWSDVLQGVGRMNPLRADIQSIKLDFAEERFEDYRMEAVRNSWVRVKSRYKRKMVREKDSFLSFADILTNNFTVSELEKVDVDIEMIREVASINADLPIATRIISRIQAARPTKVTQIININKSIINRSTLNFEGEENVEDSVIIGDKKE